MSLRAPSAANQIVVVPPQDGAPVLSLLCSDSIIDKIDSELENFHFDGSSL
jgi:hypothetical protein